MNYNIYFRWADSYYRSYIKACGNMEVTEYGRECFFRDARADADRDMSYWCYRLRLAPKGKYAVSA